MSSAFSGALQEREFRRGPRDFSRGGPLQPELLTTLLLYMVADGNRRGYRHLLGGFWDEARSYGLPLPTSEPVSSASFCAARHKLTCELLRDVIHRVADGFFEQSTAVQRRWRGRRVFAVDGTKLNLQRSPELEQAFGVPPAGYCPQVLMTTLLDVCAKAPVDLVVSPYRANERDHLLDLLPRLGRGDVIVLDRGYPSHAVVRELVAAEVDFLIRVPSSSSFTIIDHLRESSADEYTYCLDPPRDAPPSWSAIKVRVVQLEHPDGDSSFFFTSLPRSQFSRPALRDLYHKRWEIEEFYKLLQGPYIGQGQFRSKTAAGVVQEIHALVLFLLIARVLTVEAEASTSGGHPLSQKAAVLGLAAYVTRLFLASNPDYLSQELHALRKRIVREPYRPRPGRTSPRRSYKPRLRWAPSGRIRG